MADQRGRISGKGSVFLSLPKPFLEKQTQVLQREADGEYESLSFFLSLMPFVRIILVILCLGYGLGFNPVLARDSSVRIAVPVTATFEKAGADTSTHLQQKTEGYSISYIFGFGLGLGTSERTIKTVSQNSDSQTVRREGLIRGIDLSYSLGSTVFLEIGYTLLRHAEVLRYEVGGVDYLQTYDLSIESGSGYGRMIRVGYGSGNLEFFIGRHAWEGQYQIRYQVRGATYYSNEYFLPIETLVGLGFRF